MSPGSIAAYIGRLAAKAATVIGVPDFARMICELARERGRQMSAVQAAAVELETLRRCVAVSRALETEAIIASSALARRSPTIFNDEEKTTMTEWQPIETAPKDGTRILLFVSGIGRPLQIGSYDVTEHLLHGRRVYKREGWSFSEDQFFRDPPKPTHWMPLPDPPAHFQKAAA